MHRVLLVAVCAVGVQAQTATFVAAGYNPPGWTPVAPGQVVTLYITGTKTVLPAQSPGVRATSTPLPTHLGGFSVAVRQGSSIYPAPLFSVVQTPICTGADQSSPACTLTALTVQIPFEITPRNPLQMSPIRLPSDVIITDNGTESAAIPMAAIPDNIHVLTSCDGQTRSEFFQPPCSAVVTHADGTPVSVNSPAKAGEAVVIYAFGLGRTTPAVKSGEATPMPGAGSAGTFVVEFDFRPSAAPSRPYVGGFEWFIPTDALPLFAGLTPGQVGLYQINVRIPDTLPTLTACSGSAQSNVTIDIGGSTSFDGAAICVQQKP